MTRMMSSAVSARSALESRCSSGLRPELSSWPPLMSMALQLMRMRGPGMRPLLMALRTATSAQPAPSVPMSRSAVKPAMRSALAGRGGDERALGDGLFDGLEGFVAGVEEEMHVRVDEAGHERGVAEVDDLRAGGMRDVRSGLGDAVARNQDFARREDFAGGDIEDARGVQYGLRGWCWLLGVGERWRD